MIEKNIEWSKQEKSLIEKKIRKNLGKYKNIWWLVKKKPSDLYMDDVHSTKYDDG